MFFIRRYIISIILFLIIWVAHDGINLQGASQVQAPISNRIEYPRLAFFTEQSEQNVEQNIDQDIGQSVVARIYYGTADNLEWLRSQVDIWEEAILDKPYVTALLSVAEMDSLKLADYRIEIDHEQTLLYQQIMDASRAVPEGFADIEAIPNFACYRTVEETYTDLAQLAVENPQIASWIDIGDSYDKITPEGSAGYDLHVLRLTNQAIPGPKPNLVIMAAIHAREYATAETATRFAEHLVSQYGYDPDITWILDYFEIHILSQANPDGRKIAETGVSWRKNRNPSNGCEAGNYGVDLNRNSSFRWAEGNPGSNTSDDSCSMTYRGPSAASEPEVQAIQDYITSVFPDQRGPLITDAAPDDATGIFISLHSFAELVLPVWAWTADPAPNRSALMTLGSKFGYFNRYPVCDDCFGIADGTTDDWTYGEFGVASYTFELGRSFFEPCSEFEGTIYPKNLPALRYAAKAARRPYQNPAGPDVVQFMLNDLPVITSTQVISGRPITMSVVVDDSRHDNNLGRNPPSQSIQAVRYSIDTPSWISPTAATLLSMTIPLTDTPVISSATITATIETAGLAAGRHTLFVEGQDSDGNWGVPSAIFLDIIDDRLLAALGDVNCDGSVTVVDALFILQADIGRRGRSQACSVDTTLSNIPIYAPACDISGDGVCSSVDALFLLQCDVGRENVFCPSIE